MQQDEASPKKPLPTLASQRRSGASSPQRSAGFAVAHSGHVGVTTGDSLDGRAKPQILAACLEDHDICTRMLLENDIKEHLALAYVYTVASRAGCSTEFIRVDRNSIDITVTHVDREVGPDDVREGIIGIQIKARLNARFRFLDTTSSTANRSCASWATPADAR